MIRRGGFLRARRRGAGLSPALAWAQDDADPASRRLTGACACCSDPARASPLPGGTGFTFDGRTLPRKLRARRDGSVTSTSWSWRSTSTAWWRTRCRRRGRGPRSQAQAVCARTYVLQRSDPRREYDSACPRRRTSLRRRWPASRRPGAPRWIRPRAGFCATAAASRALRTRRAAGDIPSRRRKPGAAGPFPYLQAASSARGAPTRPNYRWAELARRSIGRRTQLRARWRVGASAGRRASTAPTRAAGRARFELDRRSRDRFGEGQRVPARRRRARAAQPAHQPRRRRPAAYRH